MRARMGVVLGAAVLGAVTACTPAPASPVPVEPGPASAPADRATPTSTSATTTGSGDDGEQAADAEVREAVDCLQGSWRMAGFAIEADSSVTTRGEGGEVELDVEDGSWRLHSDDDEALTVWVGTKQAELTLDGHAEGGVEIAPDGVHFSMHESDGRVEMELPEGMAEHGMPLGHFLAMIVPGGGTTLECDEDEATVTSGHASVNQVLQLER